MCGHDLILRPNESKTRRRTPKTHRQTEKQGANKDWSPPGKEVNHSFKGQRQDKKNVSNGLNRYRKTSSMYPCYNKDALKWKWTWTCGIFLMTEYKYLEN